MEQAAPMVGGHVWDLVDRASISAANRTSTWPLGPPYTCASATFSPAVCESCPFGWSKS